MSEISALDCLDPCCAREVGDRRKAAVFRRKLESVDVSTAKLRLKTSIWGNSFCCPCKNPMCAPTDYPLLSELRSSVMIGDPEELDNVGTPEMGSTRPVNITSGGSARGFVQNGRFGSKEASGSEGEDEDSDAELEEMMANDDELTALAADRFADMARQAQLLNEAAQRGFGVHRALPHDDDAVVAYLKSVPRAIIHVCDERSDVGGLIELHLELAVAPRYHGTAFVRVAPQSAPSSSALLRYLECKGHGTLVAVRAGIVVARCENIADQFRGSSSSRSLLATVAVEQWLERTGVLEVMPQPHEWPEISGFRSGGNGRSAEEQEEPEEEEGVYDCGRFGCRKTFAHSHVTPAGIEATTKLPGEFRVGPPDAQNFALGSLDGNNGDTSHD